MFNVGYNIESPYFITGKHYKIIISEYNQRDTDPIMVLCFNGNVNLWYRGHGDQNKIEYNKVSAMDIFRHVTLLDSTQTILSKHFH